jgi:hypothetical protein
VFALTVFQLQHMKVVLGRLSIDRFHVPAAMITSAPWPTGTWSLVWRAARGCWRHFRGARVDCLPVGAVLLLAERRRRDVMAWYTVRSLVSISPASSSMPPIDSPVRDLPKVIEYWLALAGSSPAWTTCIAPAGALWRHGDRRVRRGRERPACAVIGWCLGAMAMIAWGRALLSNDGRDRVAPHDSEFHRLGAAHLIIWNAASGERSPTRWLAPVFATSPCLT